MSSKLDALKDSNYPGKEFCGTHRGKIDAVTNVVTNKDLDVATATSETAKIILSDTPEETTDTLENNVGNNNANNHNSNHTNPADTATEENEDKQSTDTVIVSPAPTPVADSVEPTAVESTSELAGTAEEIGKSCTNILARPPSHTEEKRSDSNNFDLVVDNSTVMSVKLYSVSDSPPTLAVRMGLKYLGTPHELVNIDFGNAEQTSDDFVKVGV